MPVASAAKELAKRKAMADDCRAIAKGEEIQILEMGKRYFVSTNYRTQSLDLMAHKDDLSKALGIGKTFITDAADPAVAAGKRESVRLVVLHGQKAGTQFHAEQNLLAMLAAKLRTPGWSPTREIYIAGNNPPCRVCAPVLAAFAAALNRHYDVVLYYPVAPGADGAGAQLELEANEHDPIAYKDFVKDFTAALNKGG